MDKKELEYNLSEAADWFDVPLENVKPVYKSELVVGKEYLGNCRNAEKATWNGKVFTYNRTKFGYTYEEEINHFEDDDGYDVFVPIKIINNI